jgi:hypothetical protein
MTIWNVTIETEPSPQLAHQPEALARLAGLLLDHDATVLGGDRASSGAFTTTLSVEARNAVEAVRRAQSSLADALACTDLPPSPVAALHVTKAHPAADSA